MKKILWASPNSLLDTSSGFSLSIREMLFQLSKYGYDIKILSATIFDSTNGMTYFEEHQEYINANSGKFININDENLMHITFVTRNTKRGEMQSAEEITWFEQYCHMLDTFKPDIVFYYRDGFLELEMGYQAKQRGCTTLTYLVNSGYSGKRWIKDIDFLITDSIATSKMYKKREDYDVIPVGKFIPMEKYLVKTHRRKNILFVNPEPKKGALIVAQLALALEEKRPDIVFEVVESRGSWESSVKNITKPMGKERSNLSNVILTKNTNNMKAIYGRTRLLLVPSLYFESAARIIVEAQLNGIPVIGSSSGGTPQMIGEGGIILTFPKELHDEPYNTILNKESVEQIIVIIEKLYDDEEYYKVYQQKAFKNYTNNHSIDRSTKKLIDVLNQA